MIFYYFNIFVNLFISVRLLVTFFFFSPAAGWLGALHTPQCSGGCFGKNYLSIKNLFNCYVSCVYSLTRRRSQTWLWFPLSFCFVISKVGMWSRDVQTDCSPTCSSLSLLPRSLPPCSEDDTTSWEAALCHRAWRGSTNSTCLSTPAQTVCYNCRSEDSVSSVKE